MIQVQNQDELVAVLKRIASPNEPLLDFSAHCLTGADLGRFFTVQNQGKFADLMVYHWLKKQLKATIALAPETVDWLEPVTGVSKTGDTTYLFLPDKFAEDKTLQGNLEKVLPFLRQKALDYMTVEQDRKRKRLNIDMAALQTKLPLLQAQEQASVALFEQVRTLFENAMTETDMQLVAPKIRRLLSETGARWDTYKGGQSTFELVRADAVSRLNIAEHYEAGVVHVGTKAKNKEQYAHRCRLAQKQRKAAEKHLECVRDLFHKSECSDNFVEKMWAFLQIARLGLDIRKAAVAEVVQKQTARRAEWQKSVVIRLDYLSDHAEFATMNRVLRQYNTFCYEQQKAAELKRGTNFVCHLRDGYALVQLTTAVALADEGKRMHHCLGDFTECIRNGLETIYSIRDIDGKSCVTIDVNQQAVLQCRGRRNVVPDIKNVQRIAAALEVLDARGPRLRLEEETKKTGCIFQDGKLYNIFNLPDGFVIKGDLDLSNMGLKVLPDLSHVVVQGHFDCSGNCLYSLKGAPQDVGGNLDCSGNKMVTLKGVPRHVGGMLNCAWNELLNLQGAPNSVGGDLKCNGNKLASSVGMPDFVGGRIIYEKTQFLQDGQVYSIYDLEPGFVVKGDLDLSGIGLSQLPDLSEVYVLGMFDCSDNHLISLKGAPRYVGEDFKCTGNRLRTTMGISPTVEGQIVLSQNQSDRLRLVAKEVQLQRN